MTSNLVQSGYLLRLTTGENLMLISLTTFEIFDGYDIFSGKRGSKNQWSVPSKPKDVLA